MQVDSAANSWWPGPSCWSARRAALPGRGFGQGLRPFLDRPRVLRAFNLTMAALLVVSLYPLVVETRPAGAAKEAPRELAADLPRDAAMVFAGIGRDAHGRQGLKSVVIPEASQRCPGPEGLGEGVAGSVRPGQRFARLPG